MISWALGSLDFVWFLYFLLSRKYSNLGLGLNKKLGLMFVDLELLWSIFHGIGELSKKQLWIWVEALRSSWKQDLGFGSW
jgi:hypothetical protein